MLGDANSRAIKRIEDVRTLRATQFPEDGGPMAHPVRPDSYQEISNFYTATVYEKGAEVGACCKRSSASTAFGVAWTCISSGTTARR